MGTGRFCYRVFCWCALVVLLTVPHSLAVRDNPYVITGYETSRSSIITPEEIAENYRFIMNAEEDIAPTVENGLSCVLQSSTNKYWSGDDVFLCMRLFPSSADERVTLDTQAILTIKVMRADSGKEIAGVPYSESRRPSPKGVSLLHPRTVDIGGEAVNAEWTELDFLMTRNDFRVGRLEKGKYLISMSYTSREKGWIGEITSLPVDIEILE